MRLLLIGITLAFIVFAVLQLNDPDSVLWFSLYAAGALASVLALVNGLPRAAHRVLAVATMLLMFVYFFGFFELAPGLRGNWWQAEQSREALGLLFGGFALIPVLSYYSCRLKAICADKGRRSPAVFSAPPPAS